MRPLLLRPVALLAALLALASCAGWGASRRDPADLVDIPRERWGAAAPTAPMRPHRPDRITIHHTAGRRNLARTTAEKVRALQTFSQSDAPLEGGRTRAAWADVPYHFFVGADGAVAEARDWRFAGDTNTTYDPAGHLLIVLEGNFEEEAPTRPQLRSLDRLVVAFARELGVPASRVAAHRDFADTLCPGDSLYRELPRIRALVERS